MNLEDGTDFTYFEQRQDTTKHLLKPFVSIDLRRDDEERVTDEDNIANGNEVTKTFKVVLSWPSKNTLPDFLNTYKKWETDQRYCHKIQQILDEEQDVLEEVNCSQQRFIKGLVDSFFAETNVSAFVEGTGKLEDNPDIDYEEVVKKSFEDLKSKVNSYPDRIDWRQLYMLELVNKNRNSVLEWIDQNRQTDTSIRFEDVDIGYLQNQEFYPDRVTRVGIEKGLLGNESVDWSDGIGTHSYAVPNYEERLENCEDTRELQNQLDEEFSTITVVQGFTQTLEFDDGEYEVKREFDVDIGSGRVSLPKFRFFFENTIPEDFLEHEVQTSDEYDTTIEVLSDVFTTLEDLVTEELREYRGSDGLNKTMNAKDRRKELSDNN